MTAPNTEPTTLAAASAAARESFQQTGSIVPEGEAPRDPHAERVAEIAGNGPPTTPLGEGQPPAPETPEGEQPTTEQPPEGEQPEGEQPPEGEEPASEFVVELPGAVPGETVLLDAGDAETAAALTRLREQAMAGDEMARVRAEVEQAQQGLEQTREFIETDPVGFVLNHLPEQMAHEIALSILADPRIWPNVAGIVEGMLDENQRELTAARLQNRRLTMRDDLVARRNEQRAAESNAREIRGVIGALVPEHFTTEQRQRFVNDSLNDLYSYATQTGVQRVDPAYVPALLASRMAMFGLDPVERAAAAARARQTGASAPRSSGSPPSPASSTPPAPPAGKRVTATTLVEGEQRRRKVAAVPPAGAGVPPVTMPAPPPGATLAEATAFLRKQRAG